MGLTDEDREHQRFVLISTKDSIENDIPSILGIIEVAASVVIAWVYALDHEAFYHILVSICIAPLLLLRSPESTALGVRWMESYVDTKTPITTVGRDFFGWLARRSNVESGSINIGLPTAILLCVIAWLEYYGQLDAGSYILCLTAIFAVIFCGSSALLAILGVSRKPLSLSFWTAYFLTRVLALAVPIWFVVVIIPHQFLGLISAYTVDFYFYLSGVAIVAEIFAILVLFLSKSVEDMFFSPNSFTYSLLLASTIALAVTIRSLAIKVIATARYIHLGFWRIPQNFRTSLFVIDLAEPARLVPEYDSVVTTSAEISYTVNLIRDAYNVYYYKGYLIRGPREKFVNSKFLFIFLAIVLQAPAYVYRFSIKSTCWLYLPLVYIALKDSRARLSEAHRLDLLDRRWEWWRRIVAFGTIVGFATTNVLWNIDMVPGYLGIKAISVLEYLYLMKLGRIEIWQFLNITSAAITIYLLFKVGDALITGRHQTSRFSKQSLRRTIDIFEMLTRLRNVISAALIVIVMFHAVISFSDLGRMLPRPLLEAAGALYGKYMPAFDRTGSVVNGR
ncbi:MAG TPA: hypothetical protein VLX44_17450 [Xanthobacteraceae bacterium]|nr:hypothetical protein [Xanthobacteraceae bacterium]